MEYLFYLLLVLGAVLLCCAEYLLCARTTRRWLRALPLAVPALLCAAAASVMLGPGGGFLDLRPLVSFLILCYAALCAAAVGLGWLAWRVRQRRK